MSKYFNKQAYAAGRKVESSKRGSGAQYFSSKDGDEFFDKYAGTEITIVGVHSNAASKAKDGSEIKAHNVVLFSDGHQMSTTAFYAAKGLRWPVGGNVGKWDYLNAALASGVELSVTPLKVTRTMYMVGDKPAHFKGGALEACNEKDADYRATYFFEEQDFKPVDMSVLEEKEGE